MPCDAEEGTVGPQPKRPRILNAGRWIVALLALVGLTGLAWYLGARSESSEEAAARTRQPPPSLITAEVQLRILESTVVLRGDVTPEGVIFVGAPSSTNGTLEVTSESLGVEDSVREGMRVLGVSGRPVFVLQGRVPAYRTLGPGMAGDDVEQLQAALNRLGYPVNPTGIFDAATSDSVTAFYEVSGFTPIMSEVSDLDVATARNALEFANEAVELAADGLDRVSEPSVRSPEFVQAQLDVDLAEARLDNANVERDLQVSSAEADLSLERLRYSDLKSDGSASVLDLQTAAASVAKAEGALEAAERNGDLAVTDAAAVLFAAQLRLNEVSDRSGQLLQAQASYNSALREQGLAAETYLEAVMTNGATVPLGEIVFVEMFPLTVIPNSGEANSDEAEDIGVSLAVGMSEVVCFLPAADVPFLRTGMSASIVDDRSGTELAGTVYSIASSDSVSNSGTLGRRMVVRPSEPVPASLRDANVRVSITTASTESNVLVVPITALSSNELGESQVMVVRDALPTPFPVQVRTGLSSTGFVEVVPVSANELKSGDRVVIG